MIIGHTALLRFLSDGVRVGTLNPSLLFVGPEGVGKRTVALTLAQAVLCATPQEGTLGGCGACDTCRRVDDANHDDLLILNREMQARMLKEKVEKQTAIKIDTVRFADNFLHLKPYDGGRRIALIEEADLLTEDAANALLKLLEEPPSHAAVILLAESEKNFPSTIRSRCSLLRFRPVPAEAIGAWLCAQHGIDTERATRAAERSGGSPGRALALAHEEVEEDSFQLLDQDLPDFFSALGNPAWRREGRQNAQEFVRHLIHDTQHALEEGDKGAHKRLETLFAAERHLAQNVSPRLVMEALYMDFKHPFRTEATA